MARKPKLSEEDFDAWRDNPVTQLVMAHLKQTQDNAFSMWGEILRQPKVPPADELALLAVEFRSKAQIIADMLSLSYDDLMDDDNG